jgi:PhoPQ-activated pathogenicity-related protein
VILVVNEAFYFRDRMNHSLLCQNQIREKGFVVNGVPKQFDDTSLHAIVDPKSETMMPLLLLYLETRKPTD